MARPKIGILEPDRFSPEAIAALEAVGRVTLYKGGSLRHFLAPLEVIFIRLNFRIDKRFCAYAPNLKIICSPTTGLNHVDLAHLQHIGIEVLSLRGETKFLAAIRATPEHVLGLIIALLRNYKSAILRERHAEWNRDAHRGDELYGNHVGLVGFGRVGRIVAGYLRAMGAHVRYFDPFVPPAPVDTPIQRCNTMDSLIRQSMIVVLAASWSEDNTNMIDSAELELLKGKYFVNAARGELVHEVALLERLAQPDYFKGVALDVLANETSQHNNLGKFVESTRFNNLILTPHIGGSTRASMQKTELFLTRKLTDFLN